MKRALAAVLLVLLALAAACAASSSSSSPPSRKLGATNGYPSPTVDRFTYASGTAGTFTVPVGFYVTSWWAHNTTSGGTVAFAPSGARLLNLCVDAGADAAAIVDAGPCQSAGTSITIPAGTAYGQAVPVLLGGADELGDGTTFVFTGTDSYVVTMVRYSP